ncbi:MAG: RDD family protein [Phycisphaerae bacterium]
MSLATAHELTIRTPEGVTFSLELAGPVRRLLAWLLDIAVLAPLIYVLVMVVYMNTALHNMWGIAILTVTLYMLPILYGATLEAWWKGRTVGKRVLGLRVADEQGLSLRAGQVVVRNLLRIADRLPVLYLLGGASVLLSRHFQRLGDLAAGTVVVRVRPAEIPDLDQIRPDKYNSFLDYPHLVGRLRQRVLPQEARVAVSALLRRDMLSGEARTALLKELADHFRSVVTFPPEVTEGLSDEQYVRNVVDAFYRQAK